VWANRLINIFIILLSWIVFPISLLSTFTLGLLVKISFGILLLPFSVLWVVLFLGPLLLLSWLWNKVPLLRVPLAIVGVPLAVLGNIYVWLIPSMGELESRYAKIALCETFPYTYDCMSLFKGKRPLIFDGPSEFDQIVSFLAHRNPEVFQYLILVNELNEKSKDIEDKY